MLSSRSDAKILCGHEDLLADTSRLPPLDAPPDARSLHRRLRQEAGLSPAQLLTRVRMEVACALLESSACSVKKVARDAGFGSEYNLRRAFSQQLGVLPSEYRDRFG